MRRRSEFCVFKFEDICKGANGKPAIRLNFSKTDQFGIGEVLFISDDLIESIEKWRKVVDTDGYFLRSVNRHGHIGGSQGPASMSIILKALQKNFKVSSNERPISKHLFRVDAAPYELEQGEPIERVMLRGGWQADSNAMQYLRNWCVHDYSN